VLAWVAVVFVALIVVGVAAATIGYSILSRDLPDPTAQMVARDQTSRLYDRNDQLIAELFAEQDRTDVALQDIPVALRNAVVATEDERYYEHPGVDFFGIARAIWVDVTQGGRQGGSTITQQYVVNSFIEREDTLTRKVKEAILAYRLEENYSKDEILEMYLNTIYFGHGAYGVEAAAQTYFGKSVSELDVGQCAMLAGVIKSPGRFSPYLDPESAVGRRTLVLGKMVEQSYIDETTKTSADTTSVPVVGLKPPTNVAPYFVEYVKAILTEEYGADAVFRGGLEVRTTLDLEMQKVAEQAVIDALDQEGDPGASLVALDPSTGGIVAMVGGKDFATQQFNVAVQGRRQPGSAFKPFVLATALERGVSPEQTFECGSVTLPIAGSSDWKVTGAYGGVDGPMRLRIATKKSVNSVFAQLILEVGADRVVETAQRMGIMHDIMPVPAIALGGLQEGVSPLEMASAYGTLANSGTHMEPFGIIEVAKTSGEILFTAEPVSEQALDPAVAYLTTDLLKGVIEGGTGRAADIGRPAAGKTGTTQKYRDAWFVGYTPDLVTAVWVGHTEGQIEMLDVHGRKVTGGSFPAEIWAAFMSKALVDVPATDFVRPEGLFRAPICLDSGQTPTEWCENTGTGLFLEGTKIEDCEMHTGPVIVELPNMIGYTKEEAIAILNELQLLYSVEETSMLTIPLGIVSEHSPPGGSEVTTDTIVSIIVSTGPPQNIPPVASFSYTPSEVHAGDAVEFDASTSSDDGTIVSWVWEFDDGASDAGEIVSHIFATAGDYVISLWVTDDQGDVDVMTFTIEVE